MNEQPTMELLVCCEVIVADGTPESEFKESGDADAAE